MNRRRFLIDLSHTSHTRARTGVQRVARSLQAALGADALPVTYDPYLRAWRELEAWENANLAASGVGRKRGAAWPWPARWRGCLGRVFRRDRTSRLAGLGMAQGMAGTLVPEIFSPAVAANLAVLPRPIVAVFHDAIPLQLPEFTPRKTVARFPAYLRELLRFDGIAAVSDDSHTALRDYWRWLGEKDTPPIRTVGLGIDIAAADPQSETATISDSPSHRQGGTPAVTVLCVGSIEGRKNHLALLTACEQLWERGRQFELHLVGLPRPETASAALARIRELQAQGRTLRHEDNADDAALDRAYRRCTFTVYPSVMEGFGLPVLESIARGRACICSNRGALGEAAAGGGCLALDNVDAPALAAAIERLLSDTAELTRLTNEARRRRLRTWSEYAEDLRSFAAELRGS